MGSYPGSDVAFSQVREDPTIECEVVERVARERGRPVRVLLVASGGCTALSLLARPAVAEVVAVDVNPAQLHLVELKRRALLDLDLPAQLDFLGGEPGASESRRLHVYERLRPRLPDAAREHWDERPDEVASASIASAGSRSCSGSSPRPSRVRSSTSPRSRATRCDPMSFTAPSARSWTGAA